MKLAQRVTRIGPSPTLLTSAKAKEMKRQGSDIIDFAAGEPDLNTPEEVCESAIDAIREGFTKYTSPSGTDELKEAVRDKLKRENGIEYAQDQILISCGAKHSLYNIAQSLFEKGDEVLIIAPYWVSYPDQVLLSEATPVIVQTSEKEGFRVHTDLLDASITPRTKALIVNSPANPTGVGYTEPELAEIASSALRHGLFIISDEIYEKFVYDNFSQVSIAFLGTEIKERTITVNGVSKSFSMTGWRIGYAAGPREVIAAMANIQSQSTSNPCSISQKAALAALKGSDLFTKRMVTEFQKRRDYLVGRLNALREVSCLVPEGAFYAFPNISHFYGTEWRGSPLKNSAEFSLFLLEEAQVAVVPGGAFGAEGYIRLSYAMPHEILQKGLDRIEEALAALEKKTKKGCVAL